MIQSRNIFAILLFWLLLTPDILYAQSASSVKISVDSAGLGDPVLLDIRVVLPGDKTFTGLNFSLYKQIKNQIYLQDTISMEALADIEILSFGDWKHEGIETPVPADKIKITQQSGQNIISNQITIAIYNTGQFSIPAPDPIFKESDNINTPGESAVLNIHLPQRLMQKDTVIFNPIKDIMKEKADFSDYLVYLYILIALLLMAIVGHYFYRLKHKKPKEIPKIEEIIIPCHEKAIMELRKLEAQQLWQQGLIKEYQSGLTDIIRTYLMERYSINAPEMTTDEVMWSLTNALFDKKYNQELINILQIADLVKFAKATPEENIHDSFMQKAVSFVENTKETRQTVKEI